MQTREIWRFVVVTFVLGLAAQLLAVHGGVSGAGRQWLKFAMWAPAIAAMSSRSARRAAFAALRRSGGRWLGVALVVGWSLILVQNVLLLVLGGGNWNGALFVLEADGRGIVAVHDVAMALGVGQQGFGFFALNLLVSLTLGSLMGGVLGGLGEELGWRAVLQPELERRWGPVRGSLVVGLIWAYWHLPTNLAGYNDGAHPTWNALLFFPLVVMAMAFSFGWLTRRTGSVWPAAIAHGANNCISAGFLLTPQGWGWDTGTALAAAAVVGGLFALLSARRSKAAVVAQQGAAELAEA
ncbi:MAG: CPBP family intramembrane metalloprotease [Deltaproteobacteria bacterium]|nr:CPBP family intramembrane metalloprotease [Deltaproteobacteria bacterium]